MRFRMLGPLEVWSEERGWAGISAGKWRSLLACLLLKPGQIVPTETLIAELWGDAPPPTANNLVSIYVHRLRGVIGDSEGRVLVHRKPGYQLRVADDDTDVRKFESLVADARRALAAGEAEAAATLLGEAEGLWRDSPLADVAQTVLVSTESGRITELHLDATELRVGAHLTCGRHADVVPELRSLVAENPLREGLWLLLIRALDGAGRHAEALETYGQARAVISDELGVDPGPELQRLYTKLLTTDSAPPRVPPQRPQPGTGNRPSGGTPAGTGTRPGAGTSAGPGTAPADAGTGPNARTRPGTDTGHAGAGTQTPPSTPTRPSPAGRGTATRTAAQPADDDTDEAATGRPQGTIALGGFSDETGNGASAAALEAPATGTPWRPADPPLPRLAQLPADIGNFTGRAGEVRHLCDMLTRRDAASGPGAVRIVVVAGAAGLGKTTLAVHSAHQVRDLFPDGQLHVDLSGATARPASPGEVLARFLRDLGVEGDKVPASDEERAALYRTRLTGRRVLIVLDNARNAAQVRPLLPGTSSCAVLVTTRNGALALALGSTQFVALNTLSDSEALELFISLVGDDRPAAEPDETAEVLLACAGLPLAIRICAARLAARRQWKVATLAGRLRDTRRRLDELQAGDLEVRASFQVSYDALGTARYRADPARVFRLLGLWQGRTISLPAAAALTGDREGDVADALERLVDANLLESPAPDWYRFHDLLRVYATERAEEEESAQAREAAVARLLRWYLATTDVAADASSPHRYRIRSEPPGDGPPADGPHADGPHAGGNPGGTAVADARPLDFGGMEDMLQWYDEEHENIVAATRQAASAGLDDVGWRLPTALFPVYNRRGNWADCVTTHRTALDCVRRAGSRQGEGWVENNLGMALARMHDSEGIAHLESALAIRREISDGEGEAQAALNLAEAYHQLEEPRVALPHMLDSLDVVRRVGQSSDHAHALNNLGEVYLELGRLDEAAECFQQIADILRGVGEPYVEGHAMHNLGRVYLGQGRPDKADGVIQQAVAIHRSTGNQVGEAEALKFLGHAQRGLGQLADARNSWTRALRILDGLGEKEQAREIETELESLTVR